MEILARWIATAAVLAPIALAASGGLATAAPQRAHGVSSTVARDGLRLTVSLPTNSEPRGALVLATFRIGNLTKATVRFAPSCTFGYSSPSVTSPQGQQRYPLAFPPLFKVQPCTLRQPYEVSAIPPGYQATVYRYVALRGRDLNFSVSKVVPGGAQRERLVRVAGDPIMVRLMAKAWLPRVRFFASGGVVAAVLHTESNVHVYSQAQAVCAGGDVSSQERWFQPGREAIAPCPHLLKWRIAFGNPGNSIRVATYRAK